jgi:hypothetical protein
MKYKSFKEYIAEDGDGGTVSVSGTPTPIANTTLNQVNPNNKKLFKGNDILRRKNPEAIPVA